MKGVVFDFLCLCSSCLCARIHGVCVCVCMIWYDWIYQILLDIATINEKHVISRIIGVLIYAPHLQACLLLRYWQRVPRYHFRLSSSALWPASTAHYTNLFCNGDHIKDRQDDRREFKVTRDWVFEADRHVGGWFRPRTFAPSLRLEGVVSPSAPLPSRSVRGCKIDTDLSARRPSI